MQSEDEDDAGENEALGAEVIDSVSLIQAVPFGVRTACGNRRIGTESGASLDWGKWFGGRFGCLCKVGEVCDMRWTRSATARSAPKEAHDDPC